jgi:hypothetical protein
MKAVLRALSAALVCAAPTAAQAQFPGTGPWQGPGMPVVNGRLGPFGQPRPGYPGRIDFRPVQPSLNNPLGLQPWQRGIVDPFANPRFPPIPGIPITPDVPSNPLEFHNRLRNGLPGTPWGPNVPPANFGQMPQIPPEVLKNLLIRRDDIIIPKFDLNVPTSRPPAPGKAPKVPSWVRWEWAAGIFAVSLVGGLVSGYLRRRRSCG